MTCPKKMVVSEWYNDWTDETVQEYEMVDACNFVDTSLHSYKCVTCGEKFWYSQRGKLAEERGVSVFEISDKDVEQGRKKVKSKTKKSKGTNEKRTRRKTVR